MRSDGDGVERRRSVRAAAPELLRLFVRRALVAPIAELLVLDTPRLLLLVLRRRVIASLAGGAFKCDDVTHRRAFQDLELATGIEPVTSSLPRTCSTN